MGGIVPMPQDGNLVAAGATHSAVPRRQLGDFTGWRPPPAGRRLRSFGKHRFEDPPGVALDTLKTPAGPA